MKRLLIIVCSALSFSAFADHSENADLYVEARYGSIENNPMYDHKPGDRGTTDGTSVSVSDGPKDPNHDVYRFESFMGGH